MQRAIVIRAHLQAAFRPACKVHASLVVFLSRIYVHEYITYRALITFIYNILLDHTGIFFNDKQAPCEFHDSTAAPAVRGRRHVRPRFPDLLHARVIGRRLFCLFICVYFMCNPLYVFVAHARAMLVRLIVMFSHV